MLLLTIPATEQWDEIKQEFVYTKEQTLRLEHSLVSLSKWESTWCRPFLSKTPMNEEETIDYIRCMTLTQNVDPNVYRCLTDKHIQLVRQYIEAPMTATTITEDPSNRGRREIVTAELIYYWMIALGIPPEYQKWHLNRLIMLIRVCNAKNAPSKKMSKRDVMSRNRALNEARKKRLNTKG